MIDTAGGANAAGVRFPRVPVAADTFARRTKTMNSILINRVELDLIEHLEEARHRLEHVGGDAAFFVKIMIDDALDRAIEYLQEQRATRLAKAE